MKYKIALGILVVILYGCPDLKKETDIIGFYKINLDKSEFLYNEAEKTQYKDLVLEIRENDSFYLNMDVFFFLNDTGSYKIKTNSETGARLIDLTYKNDPSSLTNRIDDDPRERGIGKLISINAPFPKSPDKGVQRIYFNKIKY